MKEVTITKTVVKGQLLIDIMVDGNPDLYGHRLCGHTNGTFNELTSLLNGNNTELSYGNYKRQFAGISEPLLSTPSIIMGKIAEVQKWIASCKKKDLENSWVYTYTIDD